MPGSRASEAQRREQILTAAFRVAARKGLESMTVRDVAAEAGLSSGLVFFHFETKEALLLAMLDELVEWMLSGREEASAGSSHYVNLLREESNLDAQDREWLELFIEFLVFGSRRSEMRKHLREALKHYRKIFHSPANELLQAHAKSLPNTTPESLSALGASLVIGNALQALLDPKWMDLEKPLSAIEDVWGK
ncbi:MAG: TetR/AcrR family transcriptional regulator [Chloroflexota bacterium]